MQTPELLNAIIDYHTLPGGVFRARHGEHFNIVQACEKSLEGRGSHEKPFPELITRWCMGEFYLSPRRPGEDVFKAGTCNTSEIVSQRAAEEIYRHDRSWIQGSRI